MSCCGTCVQSAGIQVCAHWPHTLAACNQVIVFGLPGSVISGLYTSCSHLAEPCSFTVRPKDFFTVRLCGCCRGLAFDGCSTACPRPDQSTFSALCRGPECSAYGSTLDGIRKIIRREGILALWRGTDVALLMAIPTVSPCSWSYQWGAFVHGKLLQLLRFGLCHCYLFESFAGTLLGPCPHQCKTSEPLSDHSTGHAGLSVL